MNTRQILYTFLTSVVLLACADNELESGTPIRMFANNDASQQMMDGDSRTDEPQQDAGPVQMDTMPNSDAVPSRDAGPARVDSQPPGQMLDSGPLPEPGVNAGWIGGPCADNADCDYEESFCLSGQDGYPRGMCSLDCDRFCPDRDGMPVTFCVGDIVAGGGACVQRCDYNAFGGSGCRPGYHCETRSRFNEMAVGRGVCIPGDAPMMGPGTGGCFDELNARGVNYQRTAPISDAVDDAPHLMCLIDDTVRLQSPVNGVTFQYLDNEPGAMTMSCELAVALHKLAQLLAEYDVVAVGHIGTYNCRGIRNEDGSVTRLSQHGLGRAIDLKWFRKSSGRVFDVYDHWEHGVTANFSTNEGEFLYEIGQEMHQRRIFNIVLTPEYNAAHDNHFHVDLTDGSHFIGSPALEPGCGNTH